MKKWLVRNTDNLLAMKLKTETGLPLLLCRLLAGRGIYTAEQAQEFFGGSELSDPFLIKDMDKAVQAVEDAVNSDTKITVYGDYDCDGVTATVMLYSHLEALGADVNYYIPTREEGYGLNESAVRKLSEEGTGLIITVDNGVSAVNEAELIYELGMKLVITDHHQLPDVFPRAEAIVNPHRSDDTSPYKDYAGCGVVLKLIMALEGDADGVLEQYSDIASIGTIGDIVPLTGENRIIVKRGLSEIPYSENMGLIALIRAAGLNEESITSTGVAFGICPRINAAGRYKSPEAAAELFLAQSGKAAQLRAQELCELNEMRKKIESEILESAKQQLSDNPKAFNSRVLIVCGEGWNHGIIGIVSARLLELYEKPCIVIGIEGDEARGSARSIEGFSLYTAISACSEHLTRFGGHTKAAGFSLPKDKVPLFCEQIRAYADEKFPSMPVMTEEADIEPDISDLEISSVENLKHLQPFGEENAAPLFLMKGCTIISKKPLKDGKYTSFSAQYKDSQFRFLCFGIPYDMFCYCIGDKVDVLSNADVNEFNERKSVSIKVKDIRRSDFNEDKYFAARNIYEKILRGEKTDSRLLKRIMPDKENMKLPFDLARKMTSVDSAAQLAMAHGVNYCLFMLCLHIFAEFGHLKLDRINGTMEFLQGGRRIELDKSSVVKRIIKSCSV